MQFRCAVESLEEFVNLPYKVHTMFEGKNGMHSENSDELGDTHVATSAETPLRKDAFELSDAEKIVKIEESVQEILTTLGMDLTDDSLRGTPKRVAKAFVKELFSGLHPDNKPELSTFENSYKYGEMLVEKNIVLYSTCEHHLLPIDTYHLDAKCHFPNGLPLV